MMKTLAVVAACVVTAGAVALNMTSTEVKSKPLSADDLTSEQRRYCDRVDQWNREEMLGVDRHRRWGSPDTKGVYMQWCANR